MNRPRHPAAWLWWVALLIAAVASAIVYGISQDAGNIHAEEQINAVIMAAVIGIGLCIISATAHWWMNR